MPIKIKITACSLILLLFTATSLFAAETVSASNKKSSAKWVIIKGKVSDASTQAYISGAKIVLNSTKVLTNETGEYEISVKASKGSLRLKASKKNYISNKKSLSIGKSKNYNLDFELTPTENSVGHLPVLGVIGDKTIQEGEELKFEVTATDKNSKDEKGLVFSANNLPEGATFSKKTQIFSWTPDYGQAGIYSSVRFEVKDTKGNTDKEEIIITVSPCPGSTIDQNGGTVTSANGKIKLEIPAGALSEPTHIIIAPVIPSVKNQITSASEKSQTLLTAVECTPYGLKFLKPASLVYVLEQVEVPGTAAKLKLFDKKKGKYEKTVSTASVAEDGYTLVFNIEHFSTYAAFKDAVSQGGPMGTGIKIPLPDLLTGAFSHSIPIAVVPGRKGVQPQLALNYRSGNSNSSTGVGFGLNPGYIVRSTRLGPPTYTDDDTFYLVSDAGTTELVHLTGTIYQAKVESSFTKFYKMDGNYWKIVSKEGGELAFGQDDDSRETAAKGTYSWYLNRTTDNNGNYAEYKYMKDEGKCYLETIKYAGNDAQKTDPTNTVHFYFEPREDISSSYISGSEIITAKRLNRIEAKVSDELVWVYELSYEYSPDTQRSLLHSIKQSGKDGSSFPEQVLAYQKSKEG